MMTTNPLESSENMPTPGFSVLLYPGTKVASDEPISNEAASLLRQSFPNLLDKTKLQALEDGIGFHSMEDTTWIILLDKHEFVGLATAISYHDGLYVCNLCVHPKHRRRGLGLDILEQAGLLATSRGLDTLIGNAVADNKALIGYYERLGARVVNTGLGSTVQVASLGSHVRLQKQVGSTMEQVQNHFQSLRLGRS